MDPHDASSTEIFNTKLERLKIASYVFVFVVSCIAIILYMVFIWRKDEVYELIDRGECLDMALPMSRTMENYKLATFICFFFSTLLALFAAELITNSTHNVEKRYCDACFTVLTSIVCLILGFIGLILFLVYWHHFHVALRDCL